MNPKTYEEQRKQRLDEAVFDYIQDEKVTPKQFYEELQEVLLNNSKYFQEQAMRVDRMRQLVSEGLESPDMSRYSQYTELKLMRCVMKAIVKVKRRSICKSNRLPFQ